MYFNLNWPVKNKFQESIPIPENIIDDLTVGHWFSKNDVGNHISGFTGLGIRQRQLMEIMKFIKFPRFPFSHIRHNIHSPPHNGKTLFCTSWHERHYNFRLFLYYTLFSANCCFCQTQEAGTYSQTAASSSYVLFTPVRINSHTSPFSFGVINASKKAFPPKIILKKPPHGVIILMMNLVFTHS